MYLKEFEKNYYINIICNIRKKVLYQINEIGI